MKLFEQDWSNINISDVPEDGISSISSDKKTVVTNPKVIKPINPKPEDDTDPIEDAKKKVAEAKKNKWKAKLISNGIIFYEAIAKLSAGGFAGDIDEDRIWKLIKDYLLKGSGSIAQMRTAYCDIIIRIINSKSLQSSVTKYAKQFEYYISRNGSSGTSIKYLKSIPNTYVRRLDNLFVGTFGDWMDFDAEAMIDNQSTSVRRKKLNYNIFNGYKYKSDPKAIVPLVLRYTDQQIIKRVLDAYKNNILGVPKEQFK